MIIAFDGGAFQQGIAGGILNVAVNFLNAATSADPSLGIILVADPNFGEVRPDFMAKLTFTPTVVYESILRPTSKEGKLLTLDAGIHVLVDGVLVPCAIDADVVSYQGPAPKNSFEIRSHSARPCDTFDKSLDTRTLGLSFARIDVETEDSVQTYWPDDVRFDAGNNASEGIVRWTTGRFSLPADMLPSSSCAVRFHRSHGMIYKLGNRQSDLEIARITRETDISNWHDRLNKLATQLLTMGAEAYMVNHFLPVRLPGLKLLAWAYDIVPVVHPEFFDKDAIENFENVVAVFEAADALFCISDFTCNSIRKHLQIDPARLHTSWIGASPAIHRRGPHEVETLKSRLKITRPYILCVGTIEPRKNHLSLAYAYAELLKRQSDAPDLVVAGLRGWGYGAFFEAIKAHDLTSHVLHFEHLSDDDIAALYSGAELAVYPSLYEGFGLPVLEAMRCGVPVVTSRGTSMEDIARDCCILIDPKNHHSIAIGIETLMRDAGLREKLTLKATLRLPQFEWDSIARTVLNEMGRVLR